MSSMQTNPNTPDVRVAADEPSAAGERVPGVQRFPLTDDTPSDPRGWSILGIHGEAVTTVNPIVGYDADAQPVIEQRNVARVRFFLRGEAVDEDVDLPVLTLPGVVMSSELYAHLMAPTLDERRQQLLDGAEPRPDPVDAPVVVGERVE